MRETGNLVGFLFLCVCAVEVVGEEIEWCGWEGTGREEGYGFLESEGLDCS